jgi:hypothetical protein
MSNQVTKPVLQWNTIHLFVPLSLRNIDRWMFCTKEKVAPWSDKPESWHPYEDVSQLECIAFQYTQDHQMVCIDLDNLNDPEICNFITRYPTYSEASPSGNHKAHVIYQLPQSVNKADYISKPKRNAGKTELFLYNHYTTITGHSASSAFPSTPDVTTLTPQQAEELLSLFPTRHKIETIAPPSLVSQPALTQAKQQVNQWIETVELDPSDLKVQQAMSKMQWSHYDYWLTGLQALHYIYQGDSAGLVMADTWSKKDSVSYTGFDSVKTKWLSFSTLKSSPVTEKTFYMFLSWFRLEFPDQTETGSPKLLSYNNFLTALDHLALTIRIDAISLKPHIHGQDQVLYPKIYENEAEQRSANFDIICAKLFKQLITLYPISYDGVVKFTKVYCDLIAPEQRHHPFRDFIDQKPWDHEDRISVLIDAYTLDPKDDRCPPQHLASEYIRRWLFSVIRSFYPTIVTKYENASAEGMLILAGKERTNKTTSFEFLLPKQFRDYYISTHIALDGTGGEKDALMKIAGKLIVVFDECEATINSSANRQGKIKDFLTRKSDTFRPPYGLAPRDFIRTCTFAGTLNDDMLHIPDEGSRRYWALVVKAIDVQTIRNMDLQQLWAQVKYELHKASQVSEHPPWLLPTAVLAEQKKAIKSFRSTSHIEDQLMDLYDWSYDWNQFDDAGIVWDRATKTAMKVAEDMNQSRPTGLKHALRRLCKQFVTRVFVTARGTKIEHGIYIYRGCEKYLMPPLRSLSQELETPEK